MSKVDIQALLQSLTLEEKIGQLAQITPNFFLEDKGEITGPLNDIGYSIEDLNHIGSVLGTHTKEEVIAIQKEHLEQSRHQIPLLFMADVIHGYKTIYPIPLALSASWNTELVERVSQYAAYEAATQGIHVTFSPMVDTVKDARWGRVMESTGEDVYLNRMMAAAMVKGYQGNTKLDENFDAIAACLKHFAGYGYTEAGREYNKVDISHNELHQFVFPPFKAGIDAGARLVMTSFNLIDGIPATGNQWLLKSILRNQMAFNGVVISDWGSVGEMIPYGVAADGEEAAHKAIHASVDIDMMTNSYLKNLAHIARNDNDVATKIDEAVLRVLTLKQELGLFEDPYRGLLSHYDYKFKQEEARKLSREAGQASIVLLENDGTLPLKTQQKIALVGDKVKTRDVLGAWSWVGQTEESISLYDALVAQDIEIVSPIDADVIIAVVGETSEQSGEAASRTSISLSEEVESLLDNLHTLNIPVVTVVYSGRPLDLRHAKENSNSLVQAWFLGSEAGNALADVLYGVYNPSGKLTMSFPYNVGQIPIYYNQTVTGRPLRPWNEDNKYVSKYLDAPNTPLYPFGYGLSYSEFELDNIKVPAEFTREGLTLTFTLKNVSERVGTETIQIYIRDEVAEIAQPAKLLKGYVQVTLMPDETQTLRYTIPCDEFAYINSREQRVVESGSFEIFVGMDSNASCAGKTIYKGVDYEVK